MSYRTGSSAAAIMGAALTFAESAYGDPGKSANGASRHADGGRLPFTGFEVGFVVIAAVVVLIAGFALRRAITGR